MGFLDNLESNLKSLESREDRDPQSPAQAHAREAQRLAALQTAPHAEALRTAPFTDGLLTACRTLGHRKRMLIRPLWVEETLRLEAGNRRLDLTPGADGIAAVFFQEGVEQRRMPVDLAVDPAPLLEQWLESEKRTEGPGLTGG
jgi:hypothetical protein